MRRRGPREDNNKDKRANSHFPNPNDSKTDKVFAENRQL